MTTSKLAVIGALLGCVAVLAGCGGGSGSSSAPTIAVMPTAMPTTTPSPTPTPGALALTDASGNPLASLSLAGTGSMYAATFVAVQSGYTGAFSEHDTCGSGASALATVQASSPTGPSAPFVVTPLAAGSCTVTISGAAGSSSTVTVSITSVSIPIQ